MIDYDPPESPYRVPYDGTFRVSETPSAPPRGTPPEGELEDALEGLVREISELQRMLYAQDRYAVLLVFQALDAAGKDSTIREVTTGVNPAGFQVFSFHEPSKEELDHDFLWRTAVRLPERGRIGIFNRSYYEEVLVVRVHPEFLDAQRLPGRTPQQELWERRYGSIRDHEAHLARNGTVILKFWLNVSRDEQARRFIRRLDRPDKNWKFGAGDLEERERWDDYLRAYEDALNATSRPWAPWYAVPADDKDFMRLTVASVLRDQLSSLGLGYPMPPESERARFPEYRAGLEAELERGNVDQGDVASRG